MTRHVKKVGILGSGVMGSAIAGHFANAGIPSVVLDIVPESLTPAEQAAGRRLNDRSVRDRMAREAVQALLKTKPAPLFSDRRLRLIQTGNLEDDLARLAEVDWIIEVVKEDLAIKKKLLARVAPHVGPQAILSSNTSGLSLAAMAEVLPADLRPRFLGTHFFNPPRYMKLCELIPTAHTDEGVLQSVADFARDHLGKGIVQAKDTPNFIANRIGAHAMMIAVRVMQELGLSIEEVDALTGPVIGRPKTATFQLADLVGLDTFLHVADNIYPLIPEDEGREVFKVPGFLRAMVEKGLLGRKSGGGFYRMVKGPDRQLLVIDLDHLTYRERRKPSFPELEAAAATESRAERLRQLALGKSRASQAIWKLLAPTLSYAAMRLGEICEDAAAIDRAMRWGFNWELGPFEIWDAVGFQTVARRLEQESYPLPGWVTALVASGAESIYREQDGVRCSVSASPQTLVPVPVDARSYDFELLRRRSGGEIKRNPGASLLDLGDGVFCLEFHSKMNAIGQDTINMMVTACEQAETSGQALVVANLADNFSVGANLMLLLLEAQEGNWDDIDLVVRAFQAANNRLEQCQVPVVVAPHGLALAGGCEVAMAGNAVQAAAETYLGLVEFGAGLVPAGGGCLRLYKRNVALLPDPQDLYPALKRTFETIGMAMVASSAEQARDLAFLRPGDRWSLNRDHLVADAKDLALALARAAFVPPRPEASLAVMGTAGAALVDSVLYNMAEARFISAHDRKIGRELGRILSGGALPGPTTVPEQHVLDLERESFLRLVGEPKTQERMQHLLKTGKPLRN